MRFRFIRAVCPTLLLALAAQGHVGSPDVYLDGKAGPYQLFVTIRPPMVIPGVAEIEVRSQSVGVAEIRVVPVPITGQAAKFAPVADKLARSPQDAQFFTGSLWIMAAGSWEVRITVSGAKGDGVLAVPLPAAAQMTRPMQRGLGALLSVLMLFLVGGLVAIVGANTREAKLKPGVAPDPTRKRKARMAMSIAFAIVISVLWFGDRWWNAVENDYRNDLYKPLNMDASLDSAGVLTLGLRDPGESADDQDVSWGEKFFVRGVDDLVVDHGHLMHLYAIRQPGLDVVYHLHPDRTGAGTFRLALPAMPPGTYKLYADIVHANGFPETLVAKIDVPRLAGRPLSGDDASGAAAAWDSVTPAPVFTLPDGYRMQWLDAGSAAHAREPRYFRFRLLDPHGEPARDMVLYMGMPGHAAFVKTDGTVFAHIHPSGSVSMAALMLAQNSSANAGVKMASMDMSNTDMSSMDMPGMERSGSSALPAEVAFPYGFPTPGRYRIFVQMKHGSTVETGVFDTDVR